MRGLSQGSPARLSPELAQRIAQECYGEVLAYCRRHAPVGHEAGDLAQEAFLRFVRRGAYREEGKPLAYLLVIARSVCIDAGRKRALATVALDFDPVDEGSALDGGPADCAFAANGLAADCDDPRLERALATLPPELQEAIELRYGAGLELGEIAQVLGLSRFAAGRRIKRALRILRREMEGEKDVQ